MQCYKVRIGRRVLVAHLESSRPASQTSRASSLPLNIAQAQPSFAAATNFQHDRPSLPRLNAASNLRGRHQGDGRATTDWLSVVQPTSGLLILGYQGGGATARPCFVQCDRPLLRSEFINPVDSFRPKPARQVAPKQPDGEPWLLLFGFSEAAVRDLTDPATSGCSTAPVRPSHSDWAPPFKFGGSMTAASDAGQ